MPRIKNEDHLAKDVNVALLDEFTRIAARAAAAILAIAAPAATRRDKTDSSPVTAADVASEAVILDGLRRLLPGVPTVSEEAGPERPRPQPSEPFLLVDPLDGTRDFLAGLPEYTVNIALVSEGRPVAGVVAAPALGLAWRGIAGVGANRVALAPGGPAGAPTPIHTRAWPSSTPRVLVSRSHLDAATVAYMEHLPQAERIACGSSLKFCRLAEGAADLYPRLAPTSEWDLAAGNAVLTAAGGVVTRPDGAPLSYDGGAGGSILVPSFVAWGDRTAAAKVR
jgi:3'(2'), 5'-bisphosphate nucleotidase